MTMVDVTAIVPGVDVVLDQYIKGGGPGVYIAHGSDVLLLRCWSNIGKPLATALDDLSIASSAASCEKYSRSSPLASGHCAFLTRIWAHNGIQTMGHHMRNRSDGIHVLAGGNDTMS